MHGNRVLILLMSFKITYLQMNHLENIIMPERIIFHNINSQLHILMNKIFNSLRLGQDFTRAAKIQGLLTMHSDLNNKAEKYTSIYGDIQNITRFKAMGITTGLEKIFEDIIREETYHLEISRTNITLQNNDTFDNELADFVNEVLDKITKFSIKDVVKVSKEFRVDKNKKLTLQQKTRDIKVWKPQISNEDLDTENGTRRIYKGKKTKIKKYPFLVSIHVMNEFMCAGSIISKDLVITAATCLQIAYKNLRYRENTSSIFVRVGSDHAKRHGELIPIIEVHIHPGYDPQTLKNNIAIVKIRKRLKFSKKRKIQRIDYDRNGDYLDDDINSVTVLGWGAKDVNEEASKMQRLSVARLNIYDIDECKKIYSSYYVTYKHFCAGFVSKGGGACNRDVGGPGIVSGELVGIISFGPTVCGMADAPTVFTKLVYFADWIDDIISQKPQVRTAKTTKRTLSATYKMPRAFSMPTVLTTTDSALPVTEISDLKTTEVIYPDELLILKEILQEIVLSNNSIIDYILYGDVLADESEAKNLLTTTEKVDIYHHPLVNQSIFLIERQKQIFRTVEPMSGDDNEDSSSYEGTDTGVKILESLVGFTQTLKETAKVRFNVLSNQNPKHITTHKMIYKLKEYANRHLDDRLKNDPHDSSSYYEEGISIEENTLPVYGKTTTTTKPSTTLPRTKATKFLENIKLENYRNVVFKLNKLKDSRDITYNKKEKDILNKMEHVKNMKTKSDKKIKRENRHVENEDKIKMTQRKRTTDNRLLGVAISYEDFNYYDNKRPAQRYDMRSRDEDRGPIRWRFRSRG